MELCGDSEPAAGLRDAARRIIALTREGRQHGANQESVKSWLSEKNEGIEKLKRSNVSAREGGRHPNTGRWWISPSIFDAAHRQVANHMHPEWSD